MGVDEGRKHTVLLRNQNKILVSGESEVMELYFKIIF